MRICRSLKVPYSVPSLSSYISCQNQRTRIWQYTQINTDFSSPLEAIKNTKYIQDYLDKFQIYFNNWKLIQPHENSSRHIHQKKVNTHGLYKNNRTLYFVDPYSQISRNHSRLENNLDLGNNKKNEPSLFRPKKIPTFYPEIVN